MANVELKIVKSAVTPKSLKDGEYIFKGVSVGKWNIPKTDDAPATEIGYLELTTESGIPIRLPATSLGFIKVGVGKDAKTLSELLAKSETDTIKVSDVQGGVLIVTVMNERRQLTFKGVSAKQLLG